MTGQSQPIALAATIGPVVDLLERELLLAGIEAPGTRPASVREFTLWYLQVVQLLQAHCTQGDDHPPMARGEVELMCRTALSARTLEEAIALCARFCDMLHPRAGHCELVVGRGVASFRLDSLRSQPTTAGSLVDITGLFAFRQLFQWLVGVELQLLQVNIGPVLREDVLPFLKLFGAPVLTGGDCYAMDFPAEVLRLPVVRDMGEFPLFFAVFPCAVFENTHNTLPEQVLSMISASLRQRAGIPTQQQLATALGLSLSTFRRRLAHSGAAYRQLRAECLRDTASHWLATDMPVKEISVGLGFSDPGAFRRAFRQWTGVSPSRWRQARTA